MKWILRFFSRSFLIRMSIFFQPLMRIYFGGNKFIDPIDGSGYRKFYLMVMERLFVTMLFVPGLFLGTTSFAMALFGKRNIFFKQKLKVLHVARTSFIKI